MDNNGKIVSDSKSAKRRVEQADKMAQSGMITAEEAERLRSARTSEESEQVILDIRVRHAIIRTETAVAEGAMTQGEADGFLERVRAGEHSRGLRSHLSQFRPRRRSRGDADAILPTSKQGERELPL